MSPNDSIGTERQKIDTSATMWDVIAQLSEGNPGALTTLVSLSKIKEPSPGLFLMLALDDMNMRGPQIWVAWKDWAGENMEKFVGGLDSRDAEMVARVNRECFFPPNNREKAVERGGSWAHHE